VAVVTTDRRAIVSPYGGIFEPALSAGTCANVWLASQQQGHPEAFMRLISVLKVLGAIVAGIVGIPLALWLSDLVPISSSQDQCSFGSVQNSDYRRLLAIAKARPGTVWPGLSNGVFWPSDRLLGVPTSEHTKKIAAYLLQEIKSLHPTDQSPDATVAVIHAVARSIGAEHDRVVAIPESLSTEAPKRGVIYLEYLMPQRRFAPICLHCLAPIWSWSTIQVSLKSEHRSTEYKLDQVVVHHAGLKYNPQKQHSASCPSLNGGTSVRG
jgi:hypothetical protein